MDGCDCLRVRRLARQTPQKVRQEIRSEGSDRPLTTSILNLLYNAVIVGSVATTLAQKRILDKNRALVWQLLSDYRSLAWKKRTLESNPSIVIAIASLCPRPRPDVGL